MHTTIVFKSILAGLLFSTSLVASPLPPSDITELWVTGEPFNATKADLPKAIPNFNDFLHHHLPLITKLELVAEHNILMNRNDHMSIAISSRATDDIASLDRLFINENLLKRQSLQICKWLPSSPAFTNLSFSPPTTADFPGSMFQVQKLCEKILGEKAGGGGEKSTRTLNERIEDKTHIQVFLYEVLEMAKQLMIVHPESNASGNTDGRTNMTAGFFNTTAPSHSQNTAALSFEEMHKEMQVHSFGITKGPANRVLCAVFESWCREEVRQLGGWVAELKDFTAVREEFKIGV